MSTPHLESRGSDIRGVRALTRNELIVGEVESCDCFPTGRGNRCRALVNGERAYPAMLEAINGATSHIYLCMYQFDEDEIGSEFADSLAAAATRGADVRLLLDAWGDLKSHPSVRGRLRSTDVKVAAFHPLTRMWKYNQRYHRKLLLVDGAVGFTGGMNIRDRNLVESYGGNPMRDTVFQIEGTSLQTLEALFLNDWQYCGGRLAAVRTTERVLVGDEDLTIYGAGVPFRKGSLVRALLGAINSARKCISICTPFFFPDRRLLEALATASERGAEVEVILPTGDFRFLSWCATDSLQYLLQRGCSAFLSPPPYDHSKIFVIDDSVWIGTVNLDYRSLHINWEIALVCRGESILEQAERIVAEQRASGPRLNLPDLREDLPKMLARKVIVGALGRLF